MQNLQRGTPQKRSVGNPERKPSAINQGSRYNPVKDSPISTKYERIHPIKPEARPVNKAADASMSHDSSSKSSHTVLRDFLFGFAVGLAVFGTAAIIVCSALLRMI